MTVHQLLKKDIDSTVKRAAVTRGWLSLLSSSKVLMRWEAEKKSDRPYFSYNRLESKLMLALQIGELNFLTNRRKENEKDLGATMCYVKVCGGEDSLDHVSQCYGYETRPPGAGAGEKEIAEYLVELNKERNKKFLAPLVVIRH